MWMLLKQRVKLCIVILKPFTSGKGLLQNRCEIQFEKKQTKSTVTWSVDIQNVSNAKNIFGDYFDPLSGTTKTSYQAPLIPILSYKVDF